MPAPGPDGPTDPTDPTGLIDLVGHDQDLHRVIDSVSPHPDGGRKVLRARWTADGSPVVLKTDLGELEAVWMPAVSSRTDDVVATVRAHGRTLAGRELPWLIMDDLPHRGRSDRPETARAVMAAAARFQQVARQLDLPTYPIDTTFVEQHATAALRAGCPGPGWRELREIALRQAQGGGRVEGP